MPIQSITVVGAPRPYPETERGWKFYQFLQLFSQYVASRWVDADRVSYCDAFDTDVLIVFLPERPTLAQLSRIRFKSFFLAHYTDSEDLDPGALAEFGHVVTGYLLPAANLTKTYPVPVVPMPLAFQREIPAWCRFFDFDLKNRYWRASFVGAGTLYQGQYPQRKAWVEELVKAAIPRVRVGLFDNESYPLNQIFSENVKPFSHPFLGPGLYTLMMYLSQVCVTPAGNAKWTYRHYEAIQAGSVLVSTDLTDIEMLIPLPRDGVVYVQDHSLVCPTLERVLDALSDYQPRVRAGQHALSHYLTRGQYDATKPLPFFLLLAKLELVIAGA
jgi:hypothetical protein